MRTSAKRLSRVIQEQSLPDAIAAAARRSENGLLELQLDHWAELNLALRDHLRNDG